MHLWTIVATLCVTSLAGAETLAVLPVSGVNVHEGTLEAAQDVLRGELQRRGVGTMAIPGAPERFEPDGAAAAQRAAGAGADGAAVLHVTRLGSTARLRLSVYGAAGQLRFADELPAATPDDMHAVIARLARAYTSGEPARDNAELGTVTAAESAPVLRRRATSTWGLLLGSVIPVNVDGGMAPGGSLFWLYDARRFLAEVAIGIHSGDEVHDVSVGLGVYAPFGSEDTTPYVGGGLRWAAASYTGAGADGDSGLVLYAAAGVLLGRLSSVQIRAQAEYFVNTFSEPVWVDGAATREVRAHGVVLGLGIGF